MAAYQFTTPIQLDFFFDCAEDWRDIPGFEGWYEVSSLGRVRALERHVEHRISGTLLKYEKILSPKISFGYHRVCLSRERIRKMYFVHRLVLLAFLGPPPKGIVVNHIDGNKTNNVITNLEYVTRRENNLHALALGLTPRGERTYNAKLSDEKVKELRILFAQGVSLWALSKRFRVDSRAIHNAVHRVTWKHVP